MKNIPIILPVFNQFTFLKNIINWWRFYYPENKIIICDNNSTYEPLINYYNSISDIEEGKVTVLRYSENDCIGNLSKTLEVVKHEHDYYCISDCDIQPHPNTPPNFIEIWKDLIDKKGYHRVGFNLITENLPSWLNEREMIVGNEKELLVNQVEEYEGFKGYKAPIDTTFALYSTKNSGWHSPMNGKDWGNCLRIFEAFHFGWYQHPEFINQEMDNYFRTAKYRVPGQPSAGSNNNKPQQYIHG